MKGLFIKVFSKTANGPKRAEMDWTWNTAHFHGEKKFFLYLNVNEREHLSDWQGVTDV